VTAPLEHVGIDPGLRGGVVLLDGSLRARAWWRTPIIEGDGAKAQYDERGLSAIVQGIAVDAVRRGVQVRFCIEDVAAAPGQGVVSMFKFGIGYGLWLGAISMTAFPMIKAKPQTWQRVAFAGRPQADKKQTSFLVARELFPELPLKSKSADSGLSDAALIAMACARIYSARASDPVK
jgi:crossover junction endodeoxyribonuclease RuvC